MSRVRLEIDEVRIHRPKMSWNLYFVIVTEHPEDSEKMILTTLPSQPFKLSKIHQNNYQFDTDDLNSAGLFVLSREIPPTKELNVHIYLRHSRSNLRNLGKILSDLDNGLGGEAFGIVTDIVGTSTIPWLVISKNALSLVGKFLKDIPDRDFGFLSAFEDFDNFESIYEVDREKSFTGDASLVYSWSIVS